MKRFQLFVALAMSLVSVRAATAQLTVTPAAGYNISWQGSSTTPGASGPYDTNATPLVGDGSVNGPTPDLGLASLGVTAFATGDFTNGVTYPQHQISHLNDGVYGNSNSWIAGSDTSPGAGLDLASRPILGTLSLTAFAFSRNEGLNQFNDRAQNTSYTVQYTDVKSSTSILAGMQTGDNFPNPPTSHAGTPLAVTGNASTGWVTAGTIAYGGGASGSFSPWLFNQYSITDSLGQPLLGVTGIRLVGLNPNDTDIDELQVFGQATPEPSTFVLAGLGGLGLLIACRQRKQLRANLHQSTLVKAACCFLAISLLFGSIAEGTVITYDPGTLTAGASPVAVTALSNSTSGGNGLTNIGSPQLFGFHTAGADAAFNGYNYISYSGGSALTTAAALYTGNNARSVAAVYDTPTYTSAQNGSFNAFVAGQVSTPVGASWFGLESRFNNVVGNPYLVTFGVATDLTTSGQNAFPNPGGNPGNAPIAGQLQFALATYSAGTESLYWAYGTHGAVQSVSITGVTLASASAPFTVGASGDGNSPVNVGQVVVFNSGLSSAAAIAEIQLLQASYAVPVPEPSTMVLSGIALVGLLVARRRRSAI